MCLFSWWRSARWSPPLSDRLAACLLATRSEEGRPQGQQQEKSGERETRRKGIAAARVDSVLTSPRLPACLLALCVVQGMITCLGACPGQCPTDPTCMAQCYATCTTAEQACVSKCVSRQGAQRSVGRSNASFCTAQQAANLWLIRSYLSSSVLGHCVLREAFGDARSTCVLQRGRGCHWQDDRGRLPGTSTYTQSRKCLRAAVLFT